MLDHDEGLTKTYNRFHSPDEREPAVLELRRLHSEMDVAVLQAYGWDDLADQAAQPDFCQFLLDYEEEDDDDSEPMGASPGSRDSTDVPEPGLAPFGLHRKSKKKKPWRLRWPDEFRDEVLARLLELNEQRHNEELLFVKSQSTEAKPAKQPSKKPAKAKATPLFDGLNPVDLPPDAAAQ